MYRLNKNKRWANHPRMHFLASRKRLKVSGTLHDIDEEPAESFKIKNKNPKEFLQFSNGSFKLVMVDEPDVPSRTETVVRNFSPMAASTPNRTSTNQNEGSIFAPQLTLSKFLGLSNESTTARRPHKEIAVRLRNFVGDSQKAYETIIVEDSSDDEDLLCSSQSDISRINTQGSVVKQCCLGTDSRIVRKDTPHDGVFKKPSLPLQRKSVKKENLHCKSSNAKHKSQLNDLDRKKAHILQWKSTNKTRQRHTLDLESFYVSSEDSSDDEISFCSPHSNVSRKKTTMDGVFKKPILTPLQRKTPYKALKESTLDNKNVDPQLRECESPHAKRKKAHITPILLASNDKKQSNVTQETPTKHHIFDLYKTDETFFRRNQICDVKHQTRRDFSSWDNPKEITGVMLREYESTTRADESHSVGKKRLHSLQKETLMQIISNWKETKELAESILRQCESPPDEDKIVGDGAKEQSNTTFDKTASQTVKPILNLDNPTEAAKAKIRECESPPRPSTSHAFANKRQANTEKTTINWDNPKEALETILAECESPPRPSTSYAFANKRQPTTEKTTINWDNPKEALETILAECESRPRPSTSHAFANKRQAKTEKTIINWDNPKEALEAILAECESPPRPSTSHAFANKRQPTTKKTTINWDNPKEACKAIIAECESPPRPSTSHAFVNKHQPKTEKTLINLDNPKEACEAILAECESPPRPSTSHAFVNKRQAKSEKTTINWDSPKEACKAIIAECKSPPRPSTSLAFANKRQAKTEKTIINWDNPKEALEAILAECESPPRPSKIHTSSKRLKNTSDGATVNLDSTQDFLNVIFNECGISQSRRNIKSQTKGTKRKNINETLYFDMEPPGTKHSSEVQDTSSFQFSDATFFSAEASSGVDQLDTMNLTVGGFPSESFSENFKYCFEESSDSDLSDICELFSSI